MAKAKKSSKKKVKSAKPIKAEDTKPKEEELDAEVVLKPLRDIVQGKNDQLNDGTVN